MSAFLFLLSQFSLISLIVCELPAHLKGFDDSILFKINWPGKDVDLFEKPRNEEEGEILQVTTHEKEKYRCELPTLKAKEQNSDEDYNGPNPIELLAPVFESSPCSSLLESYWTYELCHGRYIRQYHEEREGKKFKLQEYILGRWDKSMTAKLSADYDREIAEGKPLVPPLKKLDGISLPYVQLNFTDGTLCDLNGKPRRTAVLYVCFAGTKNDIFVIKETSTCEYEVIVISSELCKHPKYRPQVTGENEINCRPVDGASKKPMSLIQMETEAFRQKHFSSFGDPKNEKMFAVYSIDEYKDKDGRMQVRVELRPVDEPDIPTTLESPATTAPDVPLPVQDFLSGKGCIEGGGGWWKYKFCYGQYVEQYHVDKRKEGGEHRISISLGVFDKSVHLDWLKRNPHKRPKPLLSRTYVSHFYSGGDLCEKTGKPRETEVKLKCVEKRGTVSIYLLEPHVCQYILGVESPLVCEFLDKVDATTGLINL